MQLAVRKETMSNLLTKAFLLLAFLGAAYAVKCHEIYSCFQVSKGFFRPFCPTREIECLESAIADCKLSQPDEDMSIYEHKAKIERNMCPGNDAKGGAGTATDTQGDTSGDAAGSNEGSSDTGIPENPTCRDYTRCLPPDVEKTFANYEMDLATICPLIKPTIKCLKTVFVDCKGNNDAFAIGIRKMEDQLEAIQEKVDKYCNGGYDAHGGAGNTSPSSSSTKSVPGIGDHGNNAKGGAATATDTKGVTSGDAAGNNEGSSDTGSGITQTTWLLAIFSALALFVARLL